MSNLLPAPQGRDLANICAEHTRCVQLLCDKFWRGDLDMWLYRKQSRELVQQYVEELQTLFNQGLASTKTNAHSTVRHPDGPNYPNHGKAAAHGQPAPS